METVKIFIASSNELEEDRKAFRELLSVENDRLHYKGVYLELIQWEYFFNALSQQSKQSDYNRALEDCQVVICLFHTKAGKYTQEEFDTALKKFKEKGTPLIYTYFKEPGNNNNKAAAMVAGSIEAENAQNLIKFKTRLGELNHFYTRYKNIEDLKYQFLKQLDKLQEKGFIKLREEIRNETKDAVINYFNTNTASVTGNNNIVIQGITDSTITVNVNGKTEEILNKLDALQAILEKTDVKTFRADNKTYNIEGINDANFAFLLGRSTQNKALPEELMQNLITDRNRWVQSLRQELVKKGVQVGEKPFNIYKHYSWLIEAYLQKVETPSGQGQTLRRLSFLAEAYQSSLRFLCFIQLSQILQMEKKLKHVAIAEFTNLDKSQQAYFDYSNLLLITTNLLKDSGSFMPEIDEFTEELSDIKSELYSTSLFLENNRNLLVKKLIIEDDNLPGLLDEYLTALVFWLRKLAFLCRYRMVSIKNIRLNYRMGTPVYFEHVLGELNGMYTEGLTDADDATEKSVEGVFTFNQSILLLKGKDVSTSLDNIKDPHSYLSLSPLIIDQSVYSDVPKQTPEIYFYTGMDASRKQYCYAHYKNELPLNESEKVASNKELNVKNSNINQPALDSLYEQLCHLFKPFKG